MPTTKSPQNLTLPLLRIKAMISSYLRKILSVEKDKKKMREIKKEREEGE